MKNCFSRPASALSVLLLVWLLLVPSSEASAGIQGTVVGWGSNGDGQTTIPTNLTEVVAIAAGFYHSLALKKDGRLVAWGDNLFGQSTVPANQSEVVAIAAGGYHNLALKGDGTLFAWGFNGYGESTVPTLIGVVAIAAGGYHSLALKRDGTVVAWGHNGQGQSTVPTNLTAVVAIAAGIFHSLALKGDGTVVAWGYNGEGESAVPTNLSEVVTIAAGCTHNLALKVDGKVVAWGDNIYGQVTVPTNLSGVVAVAGGCGHSLALKGDGTVVAWGWDQYGQSTLPPNLRGVVEIAAGYEHSLALLDDIAPSLFRQPTNQSVVVGASVVLNVRATGIPPLHYQWRKDGVTLPGQTNSVLALYSVQLTGAGGYSVVVTNVAGSITSQVARLTVSPVGKPKVFVDGVLVVETNISVRGSATVSLSTTFTNGVLLFTLDGSEPDVSSPIYSGHFAVRQSAALRAIAYNADFTQSAQSDPVEIVILPTLSATTDDGGSVAIDPPAGAYLSNGTAVVTATPAPGWTFLQWLGDATGTNPTATVSMSRNKCVQAVFGTSLSNTVVGSGSVVRSPAAELYPYGTAVRLTAVPQAGNYVALWGNAASGTNNPLSFMVTNANPTVTAVFAALPANQHALTVVPDGFGQVSASPRANRYGTARA